MLQAAYEAPTPRSGHTSVTFKDFICVFGGIFEVTRELNDCHLYDIANNRWVCLFNDTTETGSAQSPTKIMALGTASPMLRKGTLNGSPRNGTSATLKNTLGQTAPPKKNHKITTEESKHPKKEVKLDSPTSTDMQRSLLIANADPSFDFMAQLKRKKNQFGFGGATHNSFGLNMSLSQKGKSRVSGIRPNPRDGHSCVAHESVIVIFGGDRHHMPFNDMFALDLAREIERQAFNFVNTHDSQEEFKKNGGSQ